MSNHEPFTHADADALRRQLLEEHRQVVGAPGGAAPPAAESTENAQPGGPEGREQLAELVLRREAQRKEQADKARALLRHDGHLPPSEIDLLDDEVAISLSRKPYQPGPIERADPMHAGRPPRQPGAAADPSDLAANLRAAGYEETSE